MAVFKRTKRKSSDSQSSSCSSGGYSSTSCSLEKKESSAPAQLLKSSLHSNASTDYNTCQSGSYRSCKSRDSSQKSVRFSQVQVREYERSLGDNPSCSSGAPIGIGWGFQNSVVCRVEEYERKHKRGRPQNEIILTRQEREQLLKEWMTSEKEIAQSTRDNLKVKFQRRRSVRNARKLEFFQNTIGKGIKKVLGIGGRKSDDLLQAVPESGLMHQESLHFEDSHEQFPEVSEPEEDDDDDNDDGLDSDGHPNARASSMLLHKQSSSFEDMIDDATSAVSGITFGDSTTTSAYEMEMFHRELELEMFGAEPDELDEPLPPRSVLGQTLALPEALSESNSMSIVSGSHEEEMSSSSSTMHSFQSPNYSYYGSPGQMDISPVSNPMDYATLHKQFPQQPQLYPQTHHRQYNPYARTSAYRGYSLRDAYRGNNKFSAFDVASQLQAPPFPPQHDVVEVTEPDDDDETDSMMLPKQSPYPLGAPSMYPPPPPPMDQSPTMPMRYYSSDDNSRNTLFSDVKSWEEVYYDLPSTDDYGRYNNNNISKSGTADGYDSSTISMNLSTHSMSYNSYKSSMTHSAEVSVDSFSGRSGRSNLTERTQHC